MSITKAFPGLAIERTSQLAVLTKGQKLLLKTMRECVSSQQPMTWDLIVLVYSEGVKSTYTDTWRLRYGHTDKPSQFNILEEYQNKSGTWTYGIRAIVRSWFLSNIGILVLKNQLIVIPTIEIDA